jgi:AhpC/TSA family
MNILLKLRQVFFVIALCVVVLAIPQKTFAAIDSCTGSVNTHSVPPDSNNSMNFTVTNGGPSDANWVKIRVPSSNFTISGGASVPGGWSAAISDDSTEMTVSGSTFGPGDLSFSVQVSSANTTASSADWTMQASDDGGGTTATCGGGSRGLAIEGSVSVSDPTISDIVVSDISDTQAKISWTTDVSATSVVDYGTTDTYGSTATGGSGTSHSVSISSLTANTTYHYNVKSTRAEGQEGTSGDNTFTTAKLGTTITTTVTGSVTTRIVGATPTPTPVPDRTPPKTTIKTDFTKPFFEAPTIEGKATDPSGVAKLEYSLDDGRSFIPMEEVEGLGKSSVTFAFTPLGLMDDNYIVKIRATDEKGNVGVSKGVTMVVDRLPPLVGGMIFTLGPQVIEPSRAGGLYLLSGVPYKLTLSAVGGPTEIKLTGAGDGVELQKNFDNGLWNTLVRFDTSGVYTLSTSSIDGANNKKDRTLPSVSVLPGSTVTDNGAPVTNGNVWIYFLDKETKRFIAWDGASYGQQNPVPLDTKGAYGVYLPAGTYFFRVKAPGYQDAVSQIFTLDKAFPVSEPVALTRKRVIKIGPWLIPLPDFRETQVGVKLQAPEETPSESLVSRLRGKELPYFSLPMGEQTIAATALRGKPTIVTLLNTWLPTASSQLAILNDLVKKQEINVAVVVPQETSGRVTIFRKRGDYAVPIIADPDGTLIEALNISSMPVHLFLNRKGSIVSVRSGLLTREELLDEILSGI